MLNMEVWLLIILSISLCALLNSIFTKPNLPPGPTTFPIIGNILWLRKSFSQLEPVLRQLHAKYGPIVTLHIGSLPSIFIRDRTIAYKTLIQNGVIFSDRPPGIPTNQIFTNYQKNITTGCYGPTWRLFRRNLTSEILHPSRIRSYKHARKWVLEILCNRIKCLASGDPVRVVDHFQYAMFCLLVLMCFGDKLEESKIKEIESVHRLLLLSLARANLLNFWPKLSKILLRNRWKKLYEIRKNQEDTLIPLIRARTKMKQESLRKATEKCQDRDDEYVVSYVDTLLDLELPEDKRKLSESEIVSLCSEFINAGTDTTSTALQWIMANLVKSPEIQEKIFAEIKEVLESRQDEVTEDDLKKTPYLKAVILEGLRRHPPGHFVLPHAVSKDVELNGYKIPKNGVVNFTVAEMGWDPEVWEDPMAFKPERFMKNGNGNGGGEVFDITGSREIKMMPFGAGRRICPAYGLAMLHLEYFVANLVWNFKWAAVDDVDLSEKQEFTVVMKNPLQAHVTPRSK